MGNLVAIGRWSSSLHLLAPLTAAGHRLTLVEGDARTACSEQTDLRLVALDQERTPSPSHGVPWLAWNPADDASRALSAYRNGAVAVLPGPVSPEVLLAAVERVLTYGPSRAPVPHPRRGAPATARPCRRGAAIVLRRSEVLEVVTGVVAVSVIHDDGNEVLLGLSAPGDVVLGHGDDDCGIHLTAHTSASIVIRSWREASDDPDFADRLASRVRRLEAWCSMQAKPHLDQRLLGILRLLAEQFGVVRSNGVLVDVRIGHAQLAAAVGAHRSTVTRVLGNLRTGGQIETIGDGAGERFVLLGWSATNDHG